MFDSKNVFFFFFHLSYRDGNNWGAPHSGLFVACRSNMNLCLALQQQNEKTQRITFFELFPWTLRQN